MDYEGLSLISSHICERIKNIKQLIVYGTFSGCDMLVRYLLCLNSTRIHLESYSFTILLLTIKIEIIFLFTCNQKNRNKSQ